MVSRVRGLGLIAAAPTSAQAWLGLALSIALAGAASIALRQDSSWDLQNYHYYNAWAFVNGRFGLDWAPAQLQSFYSPFLDLPFYALVAMDAPPRLIAFMLAVPTGIAWFFFVRIVAHTFEQRAAAITAVAIGVTAPMSVSLIGTTMNDWYIAAFVMSALWLVVRELPREPSLRTLLVAGVLVGAGAGFKLTGSVYALGLLGGLAFVGAGYRSRVRAVLVCGIAMAAGFALTAGPWMAIMVQRYGNPLFPYYNDIFRSPWADPVSFSATRFGPSSLLEWLAFPFVLLWKVEGYVSEPEFRDARPALLYVLALVALAVQFRRRREGSEASRFLGAFFVVSFVAWAFMYRIFRYLVPLELLSGAFIAHLVVQLAPPKRVTIALAAAFALVAVTARHPTWWRQKFDEHFLEVSVPPMKSNALVLLLAPEPLSYVLPSLPPDSRSAGLVSNFNDPDRKNLLQKTIAQTIAGHSGALYSLAVPPGGEVGADALVKMGLARVSCGEIRTNLRVSPIELCELRRVLAP